VVSRIYARRRADGAYLWGRLGRDVEQLTAVVGGKLASWRHAGSARVLRGSGQTAPRVGWCGLLDTRISVREVGARSAPVAKRHEEGRRPKSGRRPQQQNEFLGGLTNWLAGCLLLPRALLLREAYAGSDPATVAQKHRVSLPMARFPTQRQRSTPPSPAHALAAPRDRRTRSAGVPSWPIGHRTTAVHSGASTFVGGCARTIEPDTTPPNGSSPSDRLG
jgi:hypothetical protein